ncbi:hypothetical protein [Azomonas macrocytogenes]|uniref:Uncharacterized protein n=1 Tax=Azomonas macrocytogenes TaxID=69962 RepID=A0A839T733_AZOMA|nr:hypothetical protein [Azomonas macrocytogenes]MBB3105317.1 hypothetical protein [Azomonas macrocytogenes]
MNTEPIDCKADTQALKGRSGLGRIVHATRYFLALILIALVWGVILL